MPASPTGSGRDVIAGHAIGGAAAKAVKFSSLGASFGFLFAIVAGLSATFTACNCVAFAMIPGLVCARDAGLVRREALRSLGTMLLFVVIVDAAYGAFVGWLGPVGAAAFNTRGIPAPRRAPSSRCSARSCCCGAASNSACSMPLVKRCTPVTRAFFGATDDEGGGHGSDGRRLRGLAVRFRCFASSSSTRRRARILLTVPLRWRCRAWGRCSSWRRSSC